MLGGSEAHLDAEAVDEDGLVARVVLAQLVVRLLQGGLDRVALRAGLQVLGWLGVFWNGLYLQVLF